MQNSILIKVSGKPSTSPVVILSGPAIGAQSSTHFPEVGKMVAKAFNGWSFTRAFRAVFSDRVAGVVAVVCAVSLWLHILSIDSTVDAQAAVATDCLYAMPWLLVWSLRRMVNSSDRKGGKA